VQQCRAIRALEKAYMLFIQIVQPSLPRNIDYSASPLVWVIAHTQLSFPLLLGGLVLIVEFGFRLRRASPGINGERQSLVDSARAELTVLLGLLLGFSLPMALPHFEHRNQLVVDEANALITAQERAQLLPEPFRDEKLSSFAKYVAARVEFGKAGSNEPAVRESVRHANQFQSEMWQDTTRLVQQNPNVVTPIFVQALGELPNLIEQRQAAEEKRIPTAIWLVVILISALTCFVVGVQHATEILLGHGGRAADSRNRAVTGFRIGLPTYRSRSRQPRKHTETLCRDGDSPHAPTFDR
jgi:hypothetical protein